jgi:hypothetical protein
MTDRWRLCARRATCGKSWPSISDATKSAGVPLDQDSVVDQVVDCRQPAHLDDEQPGVAEESKQRRAALGVIDHQPMHRADDDGIVPRHRSSGELDPLILPPSCLIRVSHPVRIASCLRRADPPSICSAAT